MLFGTFDNFIIVTEVNVRFDFVIFIEGSHLFMSNRRKKCICIQEITETELPYRSEVLEVFVSVMLLLSESEKNMSFVCCPQIGWNETLKQKIFYIHVSKYIMKKKQSTHLLMYGVRHRKIKISNQQYYVFPSLYRA